MRDSLAQYLYGCLAGSGLVVLSPGVAYKMRPDLWSSLQACGADLLSERLNDQLRSVGCRLYTAHGESGQVLFLAARSKKRLAERVEEITGISVTHIEEKR